MNGRTTGVCAGLALAGLILASHGVSAEPGWWKRLPKPITEADYAAADQANQTKFELGRFLFWDKILSGNRNIACATCHHSLTASGDGLSLPLGEGGRGLGVARDTGEADNAIRERVPRNAPQIWNGGAFMVMFHDGRVEPNGDYPSGFKSPAGKDLPEGLVSALAVQAMFPVTSAAEMAGQFGENEIAAVADTPNPELATIWEILAARLRGVPEYVELFVEAFDDIDTAADIRYAHAANAIALYEDLAFRADDTPFDRYLRGERGAMSLAALRGMRLFYGQARCSGCHSGKFQTDLDYHAICVPQIGPGKGDGPSGHDDFGRERVTGDPADRYRFRTPSLRNTALNGPWGHDGAFNTLRDMVLHHLDPEGSIDRYHVSQARLPSRPDLDAIDGLVHEDPDVRQAMLRANDLPSIRLRERQIDDLMAFLHALTDPGSLDLRATVPMRVPSGLPLAD